ncbi:Protein UXT-like protein [Diplonema papillatum]|nr:Protein UXT-like protein [Diplonema papillatum]|eukprot:gene6742-10334_t
MINTADDEPEAPDITKDTVLRSVSFAPGTKLGRFEAYLEETLRPKLDRILTERDAVFEDVAEGTRLRSFIEKELSITRPDGEAMETLVDLGHNFYATAHVNDPKTILVCVGLGVFVKFKLAEALAFLDTREQALDEECQALTNRASRVKVEMKVVYEAIAEIAEKQAHAPKR